MNLGLPEFGSRGQTGRSAPAWRGFGLLGLVVLAYTLVAGAMEWRSASLSSASLDRARAEVAQAGKSAEDTRRSLLKGADFLTATASVESSPSRVMEDLKGILPQGVSIPVLKIDYTPEALARLDLTVVAQNPEAYDQFLGALSKSPRFAEIKPGAEVRPGLVRATVSVLHRPRAVSE